MELVKPAIGLLFWMSLAFLVVLFLLRKFAWKGILNTLREREEFIEKSLKSAEEAKAQMSQLKSDNDKLLAEARQEREQILKEAREMKDSILSDAKKQATEESDRMIVNARAEIDKEKQSAMKEIKTQVAQLSVEIAEKILKSELTDKEKQTTIIEEQLRNAQMN